MSESRVVARRAGLVALGTLASRVLGMARGSVVAAAFPVAAIDAFVIAFTIPNTLRVLLGEGAVSNAFVPVYSEVGKHGGGAAARQFVAPVRRQRAGGAGARAAAAQEPGYMSAAAWTSSTHSS